MRRAVRWSGSILVCLAGLLALIAAREAWADCRGAVAAAQDAIDRREPAAIEAGVERVLESADCPGVTKEAAKRSAAAGLVDTAMRQLRAGRGIEELGPVVRMAQRYGENVWEAKYLVGELEWARGDRVTAAQAYDAALAQAVRDARDGRSPERDRIEQLKLRAEEARALAPAVVASSPDLRDLVIVSDDPVPSVEPVTFMYGKAEFDELGRDYARDLVKRLVSADPAAVRLVGHTDDRGGDAYNERLSLQRAQALKKFLLSAGFDRAIETEGRGEREPRRLSQGSNYTQEEVWRLNRRVEVFLQRPR